MTQSNMIPNTQIFGEIVWLFSRSELHSNWSLSSLQQWILPAMMHNQFRIYRRNGLPIGYVSWAFLSEEVEKQYVFSSNHQLQPHQWQSGDRGWVIDFISPDGDAKKIIRDMQRNIFPNTEGRALRVKPGSSEGVIWNIRGAKVRGNNKPSTLQSLNLD